MRFNSVKFWKILEHILRVLFGLVFLAGGIEFVRDSNLGVFEQIGFWFVLVLFFYWTIGRDTSFSDAAREKVQAAHVSGLVIEFPLRTDGEFGSEAERDQIHAFAAELSSIVEASGTGEYDGDEFGASRCRLFFLSNSPDKLFACIEPMLKGSDFSDGMVATINGPNDDQPLRQFDLSSPTT